VLRAVEGPFVNPVRLVVIGICVRPIRIETDIGVNPMKFEVGYLCEPNEI